MNTKGLFGDQMTCKREICDSTRENTFADHQPAFSADFVFNDLTYLDKVLIATFILNCNHID